MQIVIITRGRVGKQHTLANLDGIPRWLYDKVFVCCPPGENHPVAFENHLFEPYPMNYSQKFQWLLEGADGQLENEVIIMDDDLRFSAREHGMSRDRLVQAMDVQVTDSILTMFVLLKETALVGFHPRAMGNNAPLHIKHNGRINAIQGINRRLVGPVKVDYWPILADMVLNLTLLTRGTPNAIICDLFWDQVGGSNAPGGCSLHRTQEQQKEAVFGLKAMFPDFVTVKEKYVKDGWWGPDVPRYDFIIQWKKAYEYGKSRKSAATGLLDNGARSGKEE